MTVKFWWQKEKGPTEILCMPEKHVLTVYYNSDKEKYVINTVCPGVKLQFAELLKWVKDLHGVETFTIEHSSGEMVFIRKGLQRVDLSIL